MGGKTQLVSTAPASERYPWPDDITGDIIKPVFEQSFQSDRSIPLCSLQPTH